MYCGFWCRLNRLIGSRPITETALSYLLCTQHERENKWYPQKHAFTPLFCFLLDFFQPDLHAETYLPYKRLWKRFQPSIRRKDRDRLHKGELALSTAAVWLSHLRKHFQSFPVKHRCWLFYNLAPPLEFLIPNSPEFGDRNHEWPIQIPTQDLRILNVWKLNLMRK